MDYVTVSAKILRRFKGLLDESKIEYIVGKSFKYRFYLFLLRG